MRNILFPRGVDSARVIPVIVTKSARGSGAKDQPTRIIIEYWSLDGKKLAENDPYITETCKGGAETSVSV